MLLFGNLANSHSQNHFIMMTQMPASSSWVLLPLHPHRSPITFGNRIEAVFVFLQNKYCSRNHLQMTSIANMLSTNLFWDTDETSLDPEKNIRFIVERVLSRGRLSDWRVLYRLYGSERIKQEAMKIRYLDKVTLNFCSSFFNVPKSEFRCYIQQQSIQQLWQ